MKYKVRVSYIDFIFDNGEEAFAFAETALKHLKDDDKEVRIYYEEDKENED